MNIEPLDARIEAFGASVIRVNGHDICALVDTAAIAHPGKPHFILADTNTAEGVPLLEHRKPHLHFVRFKDEAEKAEFVKFRETM